MSSDAVFFNRTRRSASLPRALLRRGRLLDLPLYFALRRSDLAREGIDHSGSWRFAAHIYRGEPSGRGRFGRWLDARLLAMPSARSFRNRYLASAEAIAALLASREDRPLDVLSAPCGLPLEFSRAACRAREARQPGAPDPLRGVTFHGLDLDPVALDHARRHARQHDLPFVPHQGDAFSPGSYPDAVDFVTCTGFGEFLDDGQLEHLCRIFRSRLRPGGRLLVTGMRRHWASAYLLRLAELDAHYRGGAELAAIVSRASFSDVAVRTDDIGLQSVAIASR